MLLIRSAASAVAAGVVSVLLFVALTRGSIGGVILVGMTPLPLFLVGLAFGVQATAIAAMVGTVIVVAAEPVYGAVFAVDFALPALLTVSLALWRRSLSDGWPMASRLVMGLTLLSGVVFAVTDIALSGQPGGMEGSLRSAVAAMSKELVLHDPVVGKQATEMLAAAVRWLPGLGAMAWIGLIAVNGALAQGTLAGFGWALRPAPSIAAITVPHWWVGLLVVAVLAADFGQGEIAFAGASLSVIFAVPYVFQGLGVLHALTQSSAKQTWLLVGLYGVLLVFGWLILLIAALGLIEQWVGLRRRYAAKDREKNDG